MRRIDFSDVGVIVKTVEELDELYLTYSALGVPIEASFKEEFEEVQPDTLRGWFIQSTTGDIRTKLLEAELAISLIQFPISYSMESLDYAVACHLLNANEESELKAHLDKYCKEYI